MLCVETSREAKVCKLDMPTTIEEDVIGLDITVLDQQSEVPCLWRKHSSVKRNVVVKDDYPENNESGKGLSA